MVRLEFLADPAEFLRRAADRLAADPVLATVVASVTTRKAAEDADGVTRDPAVPRWWLLVTDEGGEVVGVGMRTAPAPPYALYLLPMPDAAAVALARALHERGEVAAGINGALPAARLAAEELARLCGGRVAVAQHTRLFELGELQAPRLVPGTLRAADERDLDLALEWFGAFMADADEQAGRVPGATREAEPADPDGLLRRIRTGRVWFWVDPAGERVHLTAANPASFGVSRIGPVYTPRGQRGRGYASAAVAEVSRRLVVGGERVCLFTDQANPTSNGIYQALGYRALVDMVNLVVEPGPGGHSVGGTDS